MYLGALTEQQILKDELCHLNTLRRYAKENYAESAAFQISEEQLKSIEQEIREIDEEREGIKRKLMLIKLKYGV